MCSLIGRGRGENDVHGRRIDGHQKVGPDREHHALAERFGVVPTSQQQHDQKDGEHGQNEPKRPADELQAGQGGKEFRDGQRRHRLSLQVREADGNGQLGDAGLFARIEHLGDMLELSRGIAAHQHAEILVLATSQLQPLAQFV